MTALFLVAAVATFAGAALLLGEVPWFCRRPIAARLAPYRRGAAPAPTAASTSDAFAAIFAPSAVRIGNRISAALGVSDELSLRLIRAGRDADTTAFRLGQFTRALVAAGAAVAVSLLLGLAIPLALGAIIAAPLLAVLLDEHRLNRDIDRRRERLGSELVVVVEQLGLLLGGGYSVTGAIARVAQRGDGIAAEELSRVNRRIRSGLGDSAALQEWADRSGLDSVRRLVGVLALHREAGDLGALIAAEARSLRAAAHRDLLESIERRAQLVWVPVTVATLVPGLIFLAVPFVSAMRSVTGG